MSSKLIIDRIPPDMHIDEKGNIVWTPRLIDFNTLNYSRGHVVTSDEFNTELIKQTYQGNYNTDTISVLIDLYNNLKTDVTDKTDTALSKATTAESNSAEALNTANGAYLTSVAALSDVQAAVNAAIDATRAAEVATELSEEAIAMAEGYAAAITSKASIDYVDNAVSTQYNESVKYTNAKVAELIDSAPETLDTFKEIADAFAEDQEVLNTLNAAIGLKANQTALDATNTKVTALETNKADKDDVPNTYLKDATVIDNVLTVNKSDGTSFQFEGGGGLVTLSEDTNLMALDPNLYAIEKGSDFLAGSIRFYYDGSTTDSYISIRNGFINVTEYFDSFNMRFNKQFFGDVYIDGSVKDGIYDTRSEHAFIIGWGRTDAGYCAITYFNGNEVIASRQYVDNNTPKIIWEEWE